jgi:replication factor A1
VDLKDASGEIRGVAFHQLVDKVNRLLEVDKEYFISGRMRCLMPANKEYNPLDHDYEIRFKDNTCIKESTEGGNNRPTVQDSFVRLSEVPLYKDGTYIGKLVYIIIYCLVK